MSGTRVVRPSRLIRSWSRATYPSHLCSRLHKTTYRPLAAKNAIVPRISKASIKPSFTQGRRSIDGNDHAEDQQVLSGCQPDHARLDFTVAKEPTACSRRVVIPMFEADDRLRLPKRRTVFERA